MPKYYQKALVFPLFAFMFLTGCASTEIHRQSYAEEHRASQALDTFLKFRDAFIAENLEVIEYNKVADPVHTRRSPSISRAEAMVHFDCLIPQPVKLYSDNREPEESDPSPVERYYGDEALHFWKTQETFHMIIPWVGFTEIKEQWRIPLIAVYVCPMNFESHFDRGFMPSIIKGPKEANRGTIGYIAFAFIREANGRERLLDLRMGQKILGPTSKVENDWYTRGFGALKGLLGIGTDAILPTKTF
jgi:hypothetical protein